MVPTYTSSAMRFHPKHPLKSDALRITRAAAADCQRSFEELKEKL
jgi:hypothetical protein